MFCVIILYFFELNAKFYFNSDNSQSRAILICTCKTPWDFLLILRYGLYRQVEAFECALRGIETACGGRESTSGGLEIVLEFVRVLQSIVETARVSIEALRVLQELVRALIEV
jgi:hypothetical protein